MSGLALAGAPCVRHGVAMPISSSMEESTSPRLLCCFLLGLPAAIHRPSHCPLSPMMHPSPMARPSQAHPISRLPIHIHWLGHRSIQPTSQPALAPPTRRARALFPRSGPGSGSRGARFRRADTTGSHCGRRHAEQPRRSGFLAASRAWGDDEPRRMPGMARHGKAWHGMGRPQLPGGGSG